jgi:hypothetical protein
VIAISKLNVESVNNIHQYPIMPYPNTNIQKMSEEAFILKENTKIIFDSSSKFNASLFQDELRNAIGLTLNMREGQRKKTGSNSIFMSIRFDERLNENAVKGLSQSEGYYFSVTKEQISIIGGGSRSQLNGTLSLLQLIDPKEKHVNSLEIVDYPKLGFRGLRGHLPRNNPEEIENFKRIIRAMAFCRLNQLWIRDLYVRRFPASVRWDSHPEICDGDALPKSLVKELVDYASRYNVKVMGSVAATSDIVWSIYPHLIEMAPNESPATVAIKHEKNPTPKYRFRSRFNFCPSREETYRLLFDLIDEMVPLFSSEVFDLGIDEVDQDYNGSRWGTCDRCKGKDPVKLFADYVNRLADYVTSKGKIPLINSASFIKRHAGDFRDIYKSVSLIRKNIIVNNWSDGHIRDTNRMPWNPLSRFKSSEYFKQYGLEKMVHLVGYERRWKDRPELLETKGSLDCYGGCITHYKYMTDGQFLKSPTIDDMVFSGNHFWNPNRPEIGSKEEDVHLLYARRVVEGILEGKSYLSAISDARKSLPLSH